MGLSLYRKYRSRGFSEVIGQEPITDTLQRALKSGRLSHAYLFSGPKGVGKTSVARILAHEVNNLKYDDESMHLDIIEIDAASNRRIDEIRDLRDKVHIVPTSAKYKVYIIDEVHMLTREAFNALLKTLEEPPAHCIFILATTEAHKLPETIVSRTQHFNFKPIDAGKIADHLAAIAKKEKISIEPTAVALLAEFGGGSFRDSISMLDQLSSSDKISQQTVRELLGLPTHEMLQQLIDKIAAGQAKESLELLTQLQLQGISPGLAANQLSKKLRDLLMSQNLSSQEWVGKLLKNLLEVSPSPQPQDSLEIAILQTALANQPADSKPAPMVAATPAVETFEVVEPKVATQKIKAITHPETLTPFNLQMWPKVLEQVKSQVNSLYTVLRLAKPELSGSELTLSFKFPLHQKKVSEPRQIQTIQKAIEELSTDKVTIKCQLLSSPVELTPIVTNSHNASPAIASNDLQTISNIFGKSEVLES